MRQSEDTIDPENIARCRLCWQQQGQKISPCDCIGTVGYIHEECLKSWIQKSVENGNRRIYNKEDGYTSIVCQLCKGEIWFKMVRTPTCRTRKQIYQKINENKKSFTILLFVILAMAVIGIVLLVQAIQDLLTNSYTIWGIVFVFGFIVLIFALEIRFVYNFVGSFFRRYHYQLGDFKTNR